MRFIDGILRPGTIQPGPVVADGMCWFNLGKYVWVMRPADAHDALIITQLKERSDPSVERSCANNISKPALLERQT